MLLQVDIYMHNSDIALYGTFNSRPFWWRSPAKYLIHETVKWFLNCPICNRSLWMVLFLVLDGYIFNPIFLQFQINFLFSKTYLKTMLSKGE